MNNILRVCITGRYYDVPTDSISVATLETLKKLMDDNHLIDQRDLLKSFLEISENFYIIQNSSVQAQSKIQTLQNTKNTLDASS